MKKEQKNVYLGQYRNGKLNFFFRIYLKLCGRRDAKNKVVREDENGIYSSPFICYEVNLYKLALGTEEERLIGATASAERGIDIFRIQKERKEELAAENDLDAMKAAMILEAKEQELETLKKREQEISKLRSEQLYNMLQAIVSVYWEGVLRACDDDLKMPPKVTIDHLI